jgi:hypothetical protein
MKKLITAIVALMIVGNAFDTYMVNATIYGVTNDTVIYEDVKGNLWETYRDYDATYRLGKEVCLTLKGRFTSDLTDDIVLRVE